MSHACAHCGEEIRPHDLCHTITNRETKEARFYHGTGVCNYVANEGRLPEPDDYGKFTEMAVVEMCECGHPVAEHHDSGWGPNTVCDREIGRGLGWDGTAVCPCVRR